MTQTAQTREALVEVIARAMLADELAVRPTLTFDPAWKQESDIWLSNARAALLALEAAGVRLVPSEPNREMLLKAGATPDGVSPRGGTDYLGKMLPKYYAAMLAASPYKAKDTP